MSYILDALKKADAERERSPVPGLHAHDGYGIADRRDGPPWRAIAIGTVALLVAVLAWLWWGRAEPAAPAPLATTAPAPLADARLPAEPPPPRPAATAAPVPLPLADGRAAAPAAPPALPAAPPTALPTAPPPRATVAVPPATPPTVPAVATATAPARPPAADAAPARVPTRNELPADLRAALPQVNVSGAVYAPQASGRLLFANGLVLREGDAIADGLTVERIGPTSSVLVYRGQRFEQPH